jgi:release factor glutamine methyltransferase
MTVASFFHWAQQTLSGLYTADEARILVTRLLASFWDLPRHELFLNARKILSDAEKEKLTLLIDRLASGEPLQYIQGIQFFYNHACFVNSSVLIPRPETEELVDLAIQYYQTLAQHPKVNILDIGTGSGCISIALALCCPNAAIFALDISLAALQMAVHNANKHRVNIHFLKVDVLQAACLEKLNELHLQFDIIIANPPYVPLSEKRLLHPNIIYEPSQAIFVTERDPIIYYEKIAVLARRFLKVGGQVFLECHPPFVESIAGLLKKQFLEPISIYKDINGYFRFVVGRK